jgi:hypothetical protein
MAAEGEESLISANPCGEEEEKKKSENEISKAAGGNS